MIQDIAPHLFNNQYKNVKPGDGDIVISFYGDGVLMLDYDKQEFLRYLFSVDNTKYFLFESKIDGYVYKPIKTFSNSKEMKFIAATAKQIYLWYTNNKFCGKCGRIMSHSENERMLYCEECRHELYPNISPAIIVGITHNDKILVTKYSRREYKDYALIAGFNEVGESIEETVHREVMEEVGLKVKNITFYKSQPWAYSNTLLMGFWAELDGESDIVLDKTELSEAKWLSASDITMIDDGVSLTHEMIACFKKEKNISLVS